MSKVRQNYHEECEAAVNQTINRQLTSSYMYLSMAFHFDRDDVALKGFHDYFKGMSDSKREHAMVLLKFQNERGGRIKLNDIKVISKDDYGSVLEAMEVTLNAEKASNTNYLELYNVAEKHNDEQMADFVEDMFLAKQTEVIKSVGEHITNIKRVGPGLGEYQFSANLGASA
ncbi:soma ferritin-like [Diadema antillarum]|uniref:soma ferritin-like n=1 Tax=Diadema antillarum TaxID=105358 RepID=UPI003A883261